MRHQNSDFPRERQFGLLIAVFLALVYLKQSHFQATSHPSLLLLSLIFLTLGIRFPHKLKLPLRGWIRFGDLLGAVTTPIILGILYIGIVTPFGWLRRTFGSSKILLEKKNSSYWIKTQKTGPLSWDHIKRQF